MKHLAAAAVTATAFAAAAWATATPARAQGRANCEEPRALKPGERPGKQATRGTFKAVTGPDGQKVFVMEKAFVVCGKIPRPNVIYAFQPSTINYEWESLKKDFIPLILATVKEAPF